jgi:hypothetical protein
VSNAWIESNTTTIFVERVESRGSLKRDSRPETKVVGADSAEWHPGTTKPNLVRWLRELRMLAVELIFAILLATAALILLLDRTTPFGEACLCAAKAVIFALLAIPVVAWLFASKVIRRVRLRFSGVNVSLQR